MSTPTQTPLEPASIPQTEQIDPFRFGWRYVWQKGENGLMVQVQVPLTYEDVLHPQEEDFIVNNAAHDRDCHYLKDALLLALAGRDDVEVLCDVRIDWQVEGVKAHGPDLVVFVDVRKPWKRDAGTFLVKTVGARPILVIEVTSPSTRSYDLDDKVVEYHKAGVPFYAIVDYRPELPERQIHLIGYRATAEGYLRVTLNEQGRLWLEPVRLWLAGEGDRVICYDERGERVLDAVELGVAARQADERAAVAESAAQKARQQADDLTRRLAELEAELQRLRGG